MLWPPSYCSVSAACCCVTSACLAKQALSPLRAINCLVPWGTEAIPRVRCSRPNGSEQKGRWGRFGPTPFGVWVHPPLRGASDRQNYRRLVCLGGFPTCWRQANVTPIPKGPPSSSVANYRPISITSVLSKVFELLVSVRTQWCNAVVSFQPPNLLTGKVWVPVMHLRVCPIHCRVHWRVGRRLGSCRLTSVQLLIGSTIWAFSIGFALWVLEALSCLY